ncbi:MAG: hypothetical protein LW859_30500 [Anabaena sp. 49633_E8]|nr:hypothetical protein [Anabaena sp. 49633_E8]
MGACKEKIVGAWEIIFVSCSLFVVSCQLSVGAKHLEDKLSVIAKNSSPNASPVHPIQTRQV